MRRRLLALALLATTTLLLPRPSLATDVDGPDCGRPIHDFGDAPEGVPLGWGPIGHFPTCIAAGAPGDQTTVCTARSTAPGPTGYMQNVQDGTSNYWIGCYQTSAGALYGIDSEPDGKYSALGGQPSVCDPAVITDCTESFFGGPHGGDDCIGDQSDSGVRVGGGGTFLLCGFPNSLQISTANCGTTRTAYLNVLLDLNSDGDWNDNIACVSDFTCPCQPGSCFHEWAVKNVQVQIAAGCGTVFSPTFGVPFVQFPVWTRVTLTDGPVDDDFPWAGSANRPGGAYSGGETEDLLLAVTTGDPVPGSSWGKLKVLYR